MIWTQRAALNGLERINESIKEFSRSGRCRTNPHPLGGERGRSYSQSRAAKTAETFSAADLEHTLVRLRPHRGGSPGGSSTNRIPGFILKRTNKQNKKKAFCYKRLDETMQTRAPINIPPCTANDYTSTYSHKLRQ